MSQNIKIFCGMMGLLLVLSIVLTGYLDHTLRPTSDQVKAKQSFTMLTGLPDLAVMTEARFIRHRSLSDLHSLFNLGPEIRDRFSASFVYAPSQAMQSNPGKVTCEH